MRIAHVPFTYLPDPVGGTEQYVAALAQVQRRNGQTPIIIAAGAAARYDVDGIPVWRHATAPDLGVAEIWGEGDAVAAASFAAALDESSPDLVHLHAYTPAASLLAVREIERRRIPFVFTYHTPTSSCPRGTLMRWGRVFCDGLLLDHRCGACMLSRYGLPQPIALGAQRPLRWLARVAHPAGRAGTALRLPELVSARIRANLAFLRAQRRIIVQSKWSGAVLRVNGIPDERMVLIPHGLPRPIARAAQRQRGAEIVIGFLGRMAPEKGLHLLISAVTRAPELPVRVRAHVVSQDVPPDYERLLTELAARDARIELLPPVPYDQVPAALARFDVLAVPSIWFETGPLVVLEAFAAGLPVIANAFPGIDERVRHEVDGLLIEPTVEAWRSVLQRLAAEPALLTRLASRIEPPRTMEQVAAQVDAVYQAVA